MSATNNRAPHSRTSLNRLRTLTNTKATIMRPDQRTTDPHTTRLEGTEHPHNSTLEKPLTPSQVRRRHIQFYLFSILTVILLTGCGKILGSTITPIDQALLYLTGVVFVAAKFGRGPSILYSLLSVSCFNFFFVPPFYSFTVYDRSYWLTFAVMLLTSIVITNQAARLRLQTILSNKREHDTAAFYQLTRELAATRAPDAMAGIAAYHLTKMFDVGVDTWVADERSNLTKIFGTLLPHEDAKENSVLQWCFDNKKAAGYHTATMPSARGLYFPLMATSGILGVLCVVPLREPRLFTSEELNSLETCVSLLASALERAKSTDRAELAKVEAEGERLRTLLLSSVSHDLRTPLASITGASSTIAAATDEQLSRDVVRELARSIHKEAERLSHLVTNLLEVTRFESGTVQLNLEPYFTEELIGSALAQVGNVMAHHKVVPRSDPDLPMVLVDGVLIEQVLINILENAARYTPEGSTITLAATRHENEVLVSITDNGPGIPRGYEKKIFDKFYSLAHNHAVKGTGLGLAICAGIMKAHHGKIWAKTLPEGGAGFYFTLPLATPLEQDVPYAAIH